MLILIATNTNNVPMQTGIGELLSLENARSVVRREPVRVAREVSTRAHGHDHATDARKDQAFPEKAGEQLHSNVDSVFLRQEAGGVIRRRITVAIRALYVGFLAVCTGMFALVVLSVYGGFPLVFA